MVTMTLRTFCSTLLRFALATSIAVASLTRPVMAQSILRDAETEAFLQEISAPLVAAAGLSPRAVDIVLLGDKEINAFVAGGQAVYMNSGLIMAANDVSEVQGVIAHELGHITGGHIIRFSDGASAATNITLLSMLLGAVAIAAGAGEAGAAIFAGGQQAALGKFLAYTRTQESSADQAGASFLKRAGLSGKGFIGFFKTLQNQEFRLAIPQDNSYARTHPLTGERIAALEQVLTSDPGWNRPIDPRLQERFLRIKAKLFGYIETPTRTFQKYPESDTSVPARYARAYAWHKNAFTDRAATEIDALLTLDPDDAYFLELKGQVLLESGKPELALPYLRKVTENSASQPLIASMFGHALIATEDPARFAEAESVLKAAVARDRLNPFACSIGRGQIGEPPATTPDVQYSELSVRLLLPDSTQGVL